MTKNERRENKLWQACNPMLKALGIHQTYHVGFVLKKVESGEQNRSEHPAIATVENHYPYRRIVITVDPAWVDKANTYQLQRTVLHEALHEIVYGWVRHHFHIGSTEILAEENTVTLLEEWLMDNVDV